MPRGLARWAAWMSPFCLVLAGLAAPPEPAPSEAEETVPEAARPDLEAGRQHYRAGDYAAALAAFHRAEAAGARGGVLFYEMGYCHGLLGDRDADLEYKGKAVPYLERSIAAGEAGVDPYYYLAAIYYNDLPDRLRGDKIAHAAMEAYESGAFGDDLDGDELFRLGRLCGFAVDSLVAAGAGAGAGNAARIEVLERRRIFTYRQAAERLRSQRHPNRQYLILALTEVADATARAGNLDEAIELYGRASGADPTDPAAGTALMQIAARSLQAGDYQRAAAAWRHVRGPNNLKTPAQYGIKLALKAHEHGALPSTFEGAPIASLDRATLERGILEAATVMRGPPPGSDEAAPGPEEVRLRKGEFLALMLSYLSNGHDIREFAVTYQLVPFIFR